MPLEHPFPTAVERAECLNAKFHGKSAQEVIEFTLSAPEIGRVALVSSFGAESVVLLHMVAQIDKSAPVLFIDTEMLFSETLAYQKTVARTLGLKTVQTITPDRDAVFLRDNSSRLHVHNPDACCDLRKTAPLESALADFDGWFTGRKRYQGGQRAQLDFFEADGDRIKVNPLAYWSPKDVPAYIAQHHLPKHPLVAKGFASLGCAPCTSRVIDGEDQRAGRWRGQDKSECGIHFEDGPAMRASLKEAI
ncbi:MAG: phosphoadenylyl-sulfate reductase [Silicimonas sp.]|nr:phosphoadenylyl-sulfate reductase [Silicimonas sp.]